MRIKENTHFLLFRFRNYWNKDFIKEHRKIIKKHGYVWVLKTGKKVTLKKLDAVSKDGGFIIFKESKQLGNRFYLGTFTEVSLENPNDLKHCPDYYKEIRPYSEEWFKITSIKDLDASLVDSLILSVSGKELNKVIDRTSTALMFVQNNTAWEVV